MAAATKVIPIFRRASQQATFVGAPKKNYSVSEQRQAARFLHESLESGWEGFFFHNLRRTAQGWTVTNLCPKCGLVPPKDMHNSAHRRRFMFVHATLCNGMGNH